MTKQEQLQSAFDCLRNSKTIKSQRDFAALLGVNESNLSRAMKGDARYLTDNLIARVNNVLEGKTRVPEEWVKDFPALDTIPNYQEKVETLPVIPTEAMAGTLAAFSDSVSEYDCERIISPIKGADYAMKVCGDSMSPEYPSGCQILIKKINEKAFIEWGKTYVLDTENGAVIKQIRKTERDDVVECVSLNDKYQPFTIETKYIHGWYRVLMALSLK